MLFLMLTNKQWRLDTQTFTVIPAQAFKPTKDDPQGSGACESESPSPGWIIKI